MACIDVCELPQKIEFFWRKHRKPQTKIIKNYSKLKVPNSYHDIR